MNKFLRFLPLLILLGFSSTIFAQSSNDQCSGAISLAMGAACTNGSIVSANTTTGDPTTKPSCWSFSNDYGVWFKFTATNTSAAVNLSDLGLTYTPMAAVYDGGAAPGTCPAAGATPISGGCVNYTTGPESEVSLSGLTVGNVYYILVDMPSTIVQNFCIKVLNAPPTSTASTACPGTVSSSVTLMSCADIGTANLETSGGTVVFSGSSSSAPPVAPTCASPTEGSWAHYDLASGVTALTFNWESAYGGSTDLAGGTGIYAQIYQGASCAALSTFSCVQVGSASGGGFSVNSAVIQNLDPTQDVWVYMFHTGPGSKNFTLPYDVVGSATPANDACSGSTASSIGCNLGAVGDDMGGSGTLGGPMNEGASCSGGTWYSNENTVWYTFSATTTTANVSITNIVCNNGESGLAQFAAFSSCACANTNGYGLTACFLGCAAGTGTINLGSLAPGQTIYLAVDGNAGDVCTMGFNTTLVPLPIIWLDFDAFKDGNNVKLFWSTSSEKDASHFEIERSNDGMVFSTIGSVKAAGNSNSKKDYSFSDYSADNKQIYYRLKQLDLDGTFAYSKMIFVNLDVETQEPDIFFNESDKLVTIKSYAKGFDNYDVEVLDPYGKPAMEPQKTDFQTENTYSIPVHSLSNGVYIINLKSQEGFKSYTKKIVIY